jgi:hypothetical protein
MGQIFGSNLRRKYAAQNAGNGVSGLQISKIVREGMPPDTPNFASIRATVTFQPGSAPAYVTKRSTVLLGIVMYVYVQN